MSKAKPTFDEIKAHIDTYKRLTTHFDYLITADMSMFEWQGLPETIDPEYLEMYINSYGAAAIGKVDGALYVATCPSLSAPLDQYGIGTECTAYIPNGKEIRGTVGKDIAIIYNNPTHSPENDLYFDAETFTEIDKSGRANVLFARFAPIFMAQDDKTQTKIKQIIEDVAAGNMSTVVSDDTLNDIIATIGGGGDANSSIKILDIFTHPEKVQYIQYLTQYYDAIMRRHFSRRGLSIKTPTKAAQQSTDEIHGMDSVTWFYPLAKLAQRKKCVEMLNAVFDLSVSVDFSPIWQQEYTAYQIRLQTLDDERENGGGSDVVRGDAERSDTDDTAAV